MSKSTNEIESVKTTSTCMLNGEYQSTVQKDMKIRQMEIKYLTYCET